MHECGSGLEPDIGTGLTQEPVISTQPFSTPQNCRTIYWFNHHSNGNNQVIITIAIVKITIAMVMILVIFGVPKMGFSNSWDVRVYVYVHM